MNGENINSDQPESELEENDHSLVDEGFIVGDDDYDTFSDTSYEVSHELRKENASRLREIRKAMTQQKHDVVI